ncbi:MAG: NAD(P)/FAD-dependent oxidoreductase [Bacilli bacterium]|nr:NAD(P)/FAD-dependent oxidoreductase [Bacilli bacterium]
MSEHFDVIVVGGGIAGLSASAYLSRKQKKVALLERAVIGGRAVTIRVKGFSFNFGAHAIYGRDTSVLRTFEQELGLHIDWRDFNPNKAHYDLGAEMTPVPVNIHGLFRTKILAGMTHKIAFAYEVLRTLLRLEQGHPHISIKQWLEQHDTDEDVKEMMLTLGSSNFFTSEPEQIPSDVFFNYYRRLFLSTKPVSYIGGGWQSLIDEFLRVIEANEGTIVTKCKIEQVQVDGDRVVSVRTADAEYSADEFVFAIPPKALVGLFEGTHIEHAVKQYDRYSPTTVVVYDIGLKQRIEVPYTYINDVENHMFITDISYYDTTCVPDGGQLLQATAYLTQADIGNKEVFQSIKEKIEHMYDKHFSGWREQLVVPRVSQRAVVQEIACRMNQQAMPIFFPDYRNLFFCGDWCEGQGQLSELSFSSAYEAANLILQKRGDFSEKDKTVWQKQ